MPSPPEEMWFLKQVMQARRSLWAIPVEQDHISGIHAESHSHSVPREGKQRPRWQFAQKLESHLKQPFGRYSSPNKP